MYTYKNNFSTFFDGDLDVIEINREKECQRLTTNEFILKAKIVHDEKYDYSKVTYINRSTNVIIICKKHEIEFFQTPTNHLSGWLGCPHCGSENITYGERKIKEFLENNDIEFICQKRFNDCKNERTLRFDFWLPKFKTIIEYDGRQHYFPVDFFGGEFSFEKQQVNDKIKAEYAIKNNYKLLRITYSEYKNISEILKNNIKDLN